MAKVKGGSKAANALRQMAIKIGRAKNVQVGFLAGATYPSTPRGSLRKAYKKRKTAVKGAAGGLPVAAVAAIQEFGAPRAGIPPRPFFRNMIRSKKKEWPNAIKNLLVLHNYDANKVLHLVGEAIAGQLQQSIIDLQVPPLKPATIARKGFAKPLIDTSHMLKSVAYKVKT